MEVAQRVLLGVPDLQEKAKDIAHALEHPVETAKALEHEAEEGRSARTPAIALTGVMLVLFVILAVHDRDHDDALLRLQVTGN